MPDSSTTPHRRPDDVVYAGLKIRAASLFVDLFFLSLCMTPFLALDALVLDGELGTMSEYETIDEREIENRTEKTDDGSTTTYVIIIRTAKDNKGRKAIYEKSTRKTVSESTNSSFESSKIIEMDPGYGGKYSALYHDLSMALVFIYFVLMWSSRHQATVGGMMTGLRVTNYGGGRISLLRASVRVFATVLSLCSVFGFLIIPFTPRIRGLHDYIARTLVFKGNPTSMAQGGPVGSSSIADP